MFWVQVAVLPDASVTVQTTGVAPMGELPEALAVPLKLFVMVAPAQLSLNKGVGTVTRVMQEPILAATETFDAHVIVGN